MGTLIEFIIRNIECFNFVYFSQTWKDFESSTEAGAVSAIFQGLGLYPATQLYLLFSKAELSTQQP